MTYEDDGPDAYSSRMGRAWKNEADLLRVRCRTLRTDLETALQQLAEARAEAESMREYHAPNASFPWDTP